MFIVFVMLCSACAMFLLFVLFCFYVYATVLVSYLLIIMFAGAGGRTGAGVRALGVGTNGAKSSARLAPTGRLKRNLGTQAHGRRQVAATRAQGGPRNVFVYKTNIERRPNSIPPNGTQWGEAKGRTLTSPSRRGTGYALARAARVSRALAPVGTTTRGKS